MDKIDSLSISTWVYFWQPLEDVLRKIADAGYLNVEIWADKTHLDPKLSPDLSKVEKTLNLLNLKVHSLHAPFSEIDIASLDDDHRRVSVELLKKSVEFCSWLGGRLVVVHPCSTRIKNIKIQDEAKIIERVGNSLFQLTGFAEKRGIKVAVENMIPGERTWNFGFRVWELVKLIKKIDSDRLGVCLDTGHALIGQKRVNLSADILQCGRYLIALHIQDTDGKKDRHWPPGEGMINWIQFLKDLGKINYSGMLTLEISGARKSNNSKDDILVRCIDSTKSILERFCEFKGKGCKFFKSSATKQSPGRLLGSP